MNAHIIFSFACDFFWKFLSAESSKTSERAKTMINFFRHLQPKARLANSFQETEDKKLLAHAQFGTIRFSHNRTALLSIIKSQRPHEDRRTKVPPTNSEPEICVCGCLWDVHICTCVLQNGPCTQFLGVKIYMKKLLDALSKWDIAIHWESFYGEFAAVSVLNLLRKKQLFTEAQSSRLPQAFKQSCSISALYLDALKQGSFDVVKSRRILHQLLHWALNRCGTGINLHQPPATADHVRLCTSRRLHFEKRPWPFHMPVANRRAHFRDFSAFVSGFPET